MKNLLLGASLLVGATTTAAAQTQPNLFLFLADDCTFRDLSPYGSVNAITPNIEKFAKEGMLFERGHQAVAMSSATRHNLYTGIWPVKSGAYPNHTRANEGTKSIVHHLREAGYKVALFGKSHIAPESVFPFDKYVKFVGGDIDMVAFEKFIADCKSTNTPFCTILACSEPHSPWNKGDVSQFNPSKMTLPELYIDTEVTRTNYAAYHAEINYMDETFGKALKVLDKQKVADNTLSLFLSEHGNSFPFAKWTVYDVGVRSAFIARWPGVVKAGTRSDAIVEYLDVVPTFVEAAGAKLVAPVDGESFVDVLTGKKKTHKKYTFSIQTTRGIVGGSEYYGCRSVSNGKYRYIMNLTPEAEFASRGTTSKVYRDWVAATKDDAQKSALVRKYVKRPAFELYDIENDPYCMYNLYGDKKLAKVSEELAAQLKIWMDECGDKGQETEMVAHKFLANASRGEAVGQGTHGEKRAAGKKKKK